MVICCKKKCVLSHFEHCSVHKGNQLHAFGNSIRTHEKFHCSNNHSKNRSVWVSDNDGVTCSLSLGPGAMHDVNGTAMMPHFSLCLLLTVTLFYLLKFWCKSNPLSTLLSALQEKTISPKSKLGNQDCSWILLVLFFVFKIFPWLYIVLFSVGSMSLGEGNIFNHALIYDGRSTEFLSPQIFLYVKKLRKMCNCW